MLNFLTVTAGPVVFIIASWVLLAVALFIVSRLVR